LKYANVWDVTIPENLDRWNMNTVINERQEKTNIAATIPPTKRAPNVRRMSSLSISGTEKSWRECKGRRWRGDGVGKSKMSGTATFNEVPPIYDIPATICLFKDNH
jgi:hypothetical protein